MKIVRKWWNGVAVFTDKGDPFLRVLQTIKQYPKCYFDGKNLCWHVADDYLDRLFQESDAQGFLIDIPPQRNLTRTLQSGLGCTFDIETTGLRDDPNAHLVSACLGLSKEDPLEYFVNEPPAEKQILTELAEKLGEMEVIVTWNGDRFDIPFLNDRFQYWNIPFQINPLTSLDLYKIADKMKIAGVIPSAALQVVERFYGIVRPDQLPGRYVPARYQEWLETKNPEIRDEILQHNREDVLYLLMLAPFIYQGTVVTEPSAYSQEETGLLDRYLIHMERLEKMWEEKQAMEHEIRQLAEKYGEHLLRRPYGDILLDETACTVQKKPVNSPPIRTFAELEQFYRDTLAQKPKRQWDNEA
ncbi:ribonuclease H-like domain-containing protein [Effusibacillus dendaii]|uniref:YprB ribonuclease H-like domain-containing protein n=1 Tax=Effusibacillus dendaii TaxID=2743772 RepID=A0A7I8DAN4_9BACL|nr:ribonuclease H-like domain-containing protein [Effusibacillus dendaii]BCJ85876.1 hypothetical protein skT53_08610 [Effusibacillus dendaii]